MYEEHRLFRSPVNPKAKIWRYLSFLKFLDLLETRQLFLTAVSKLDDDWEGRLSKNNFGVGIKQFDHYNAEERQPTFDAYKNQQDIFNTLRKFTYVNCWHINDYESVAMWKLYSNDNEGIAIQSTFDRLKNSLDKNDTNKIRIGSVYYEDYEKILIPQVNPYIPFIVKRKSFEYEKELRVLLQFPLMDVPEQDGIKLSVNLDELIDKIFIAPKANDWYLNLVEKIVLRYNLPNNTIFKSELSERPFF